MRLLGQVGGAIAVLMVTVTSWAAAAGYVWRDVHVGGGGFAPGIVFSTAERGLAYLRTDMGGAYRWDASAARWVALQDATPVSGYMGIESIAPDPKDADVVYIAAGMYRRDPAAILRSADRGAHWRVTPVPFAMGGNEDGRGMGERLAIDPGQTSTLFFGSRHDGLWRSDDSGARWGKVAGFPLGGLGTPPSRGTHGGLSFVVFDPHHRGRVFVGSADPGERHLFRSDDGGTTWTTVTGGPGAAMLPVKAAIGSDGVLVITYSDAIGPNGISRGAVWRFDPARLAWTDITPDKRADAPLGGYMGVAVSAQDSRVIAVSTVDRYKPVDTVWRSTDSGAHWDELYRRSTRDIAASPFLALDGKEADFGHWIAGLAIDPFDASHAAYVTGATLYATTGFDRAGAMRWATWTQGIEQTAILNLISPTAGPPLISGFGDIAGFRHDDLSVSPPHVHTNPYLPNTRSLDYAGLAPAIVVRSGNTHERQVPGTTLAWSNDGAASWRPLPMPAAPDGDPLRTGQAPIVVSADGTTFLVGGASPMLTRDRGRHWQPVQGLPPRVTAVADKADPRRFYAFDPTTGGLLRSDDGGAHFATVGRTLPVEAAGTPPSRDSASLRTTPGVAGALWLRLGTRLLRSADAGATWTPTPGGLAVQLFGLGKAAPGSRWPTVYATGDKDGLSAVWRSTDGGASWRRINDDAHQWGLRFRVVEGDPKRYGRVYLGTDGRGIVYGDEAD